MNTINPLAVEWHFCSKCKHSYFVHMDDPNRHLIKKTMRCPNYRTCAGTIRHKTKWPESGVIKGRTRHISAIELYQASAGIGLPEERKCSPKAMKKMLTGARIMNVMLETAPDPNKSVLVSLALDNGKVIFVTTSTKGALIYKVTEVGNVR